MNRRAVTFPEVYILLEALLFLDQGELDNFLLVYGR